ncbi:hydrolase glyoxylase [Planococcus kocurii]|uniref:Hydrolase glyoxylase n=1 Tax=Planococcus kocurii TaxID=1374 RepID=A0ABM5WWQ8_9BACL|nr:MBL fold metallo-hydrolase [Planococcus kocurii]ALS78778.1 hydrolase glyoxylase [Planococcus kocurii]
MLNKLSESIYYLSNQDDRERPALGLVCGEKHSLIIDAGNSTQHAKEFLLEIQNLNVPPVKYVVITHAHWDHFLGMNEFDASVIVNSQTNELMKEWQSFSYDDRSLQKYVSQDLMNVKCAEIIKDDIPNRNDFKLNSPNIIFEKTITIDLGNKVCLLEQVKSTHADDSTIVYVPDEKVIFLGDCAYGTTTNSLFHFKQALLLPMIEDIQKFDAKMSLLGHESIYDSDEMNLYWQELTAANQAVKSKSLEDAKENFVAEIKREPNDNELFFIQAFVNDQIINS